MKEEEDARRQRQRAPRGRTAQASYEALRPVENPYPPLDILSPEGLGAHRRSRLSGCSKEAGLEFRSSRALEHPQERTAPRSTKRARWCASDRELIQHFVGLAPAEFPVFARNPERNTVMGGRRINFNTVGSPPNISDLDSRAAAGDL